jgi:hypothetical protein
MLRWNDQVFLLQETNTKCARFVLVKILLFCENVYKIRDWNHNQTSLLQPLYAQKGYSHLIKTARQTHQKLHSYCCVHQLYYFPHLINPSSRMGLNYLVRPSIFSMNEANTILTNLSSCMCRFVEPSVNLWQLLIPSCCSGF